MNAVEAAQLLKLVQGYEGREVTEDAARAWAKALPDVSIEDASAAVIARYRTATSDQHWRLMPGDVLREVALAHHVGRTEMLSASRAVLAQARGRDREEAVRACRDAEREADRLYPLAREWEQFAPASARPQW